jgi:tetratricopeptide (TPR) repeat protein
MPQDALDLLERSNEARRNGDHSTALSLAQEAAERARSSSDVQALGSVLAALGRLYRDEHRLDLALEHYEQSAAFAREQGDALALAHRLRHIGDVAAELGELARADQRYEEAGSLFDRHDVAPLQKANFLRSKALLCEKQGSSAAASDLWSAARALYEESGIVAGVEESDRRLQRLNLN